MNTLALSLVRQAEGFRRFPYRDTVGKLTIGYGLNLDDRGVSEEEAELLATRYLIELERSLGLARPVFRTLSLTRQAALLSMTYNLGLSGALNFKRMWLALDYGRFDEAADEMLDSKWSEQVGNRAKKLAKIIAKDSLL